MLYESVGFWVRAALVVISVIGVIASGWGLREAQRDYKVLQLVSSVELPVVIAAGGLRETQLVFLVVTLSSCVGWSISCYGLITGQTQLEQASTPNSIATALIFGIAVIAITWRSIRANADRIRMINVTSSLSFLRKT